MEVRRSITVELSEPHIEHLDSQARYKGCSLAAYIRELIVGDIERQGPGPTRLTRPRN